ncbi:hypothetical protein SLA2020_225820 [Shorea laevis]
MSLSKPRTYYIVGLFLGDSVVHKYPTRRLSTISFTESSPSLNLESNTSIPIPSFTNFLALHTLLRPLCSHQQLYQNNSKTIHVKFDAALVISLIIFSFSAPVFPILTLAMHDSRLSDRRMLDNTR